MSEALGRTARRRIIDFMASATRVEGRTGTQAPDIHIDAISRRLSARDTWAVGARHAFLIAAAARDAAAKAAVVCLVVELDPNRALSSDSFRRWVAVKHWLTIRPPELVVLTGEHIAHYLSWIRKGEAMFLGDFGTSAVEVFVTDWIDTFGGQQEQARDLWVLSLPQRRAKNATVLSPGLNSIDSRSRRRASCA